MNKFGAEKLNVPRGALHNMRERFFDSQSYPPQNPFDSPLPANYYPYQPGYEIDQGPSDYGNGRYGQATYHQHVYSTLGGGNGGGGGWKEGGGGWKEGGGNEGGHHKSKSPAQAMSGLALLAFLFFINMLQSCLKEQMTTMNPTVMVMTAGTSRYRKNCCNDANKELNRNDQVENEALMSSVSDNVDRLTNDQGDEFYGPIPKVSFKLDNSFEARESDVVWEKISET